MDIEQLSLTKLVDKGSLQSMQDAFSAATGMSVVAVDKGETSFATKWTCEPEFCSECVKRSSEGADRCKKYALRCIEEASRSTHPVVNTCHAGITVFGVPVTVKGTYVGTLLGGQVFTEKPNENKLHRLADELGINAGEFSASIKNIEQVSAERVESAASLLMNLVQSMAEDGYQRLIFAERGQEARDNFSNADGAAYEIKEKINTTVDFVKKVEHGCGMIKDSAAHSAKAVENTDNIVKTIENASTQLTLIGFNASIEAKRAGAAGAGFNVIAQEVRTLAEKNTKQAVEIEHTLNGIKKSMGDINNQIRGLYSDIEKIVDSINDLSCVILDAETSSDDK